MDKNKTNFNDTNFDALHDSFKYFENMNLDDDINSIYTSIATEEQYKTYENIKELNKLRNKNHKLYLSIDIKKIMSLPEEFNNISESLINEYKKIDLNKILIESKEDAMLHRNILYDLIKRIEKLDEIVFKTMKSILEINDSNQSKINLEKLGCTEKEKELIETKYNDLVLFNANFDMNNQYVELNNQIIRRDKIKEIFLMIVKYDHENIEKLKKEKLKKTIDEINGQKDYYNKKLNYLKDLMMENSNLRDRFVSFVNFCDNLFNYDKLDYEDSLSTLQNIKDNTKFDTIVKQFEDLFISEREMKKKEEDFTKIKVGKQNIRISLNYITANYMDTLTSIEKEIINDVYYELYSNNELDVDKINQKLSPIVKNIWEKTITSIYEYNYDDNFCFICSNNQFKDEVYESILISSSMLNRVDDYSDYSIGFICSYNDNIINITENEDIMKVLTEDFSSLKTPAQLEQEFVNFKVCNRIALNGYKTNIEAVYYIPSDKNEEFIKATELANRYNVPLIKLKRDKN